MKKTLHYLLILSTSFLFSTLNAQELVYEQDHGVSFNKGTIDSDALIAIIQKKQEELNKFVLGRIVTKSWIESSTNPNDSRLNNFTTKYLIYETLNELTITADKSAFGKNTLELVKESAIIFGLAVAVNDKYYGDFSDFEEKLTRNLNQQTAIDENKILDTIGFNQTIDIVLNICITNPALKGYFPIYSQLANQDDENRAWYENDSRYFQNKDSLEYSYLNLSGRINSFLNVITEIKTIKNNIDLLKEGKLDTLLLLSNELWYSLKKGDTLNLAVVNNFKTVLAEVNALLPIDQLTVIPGFKNIYQKIDSVVTVATSKDKIEHLNGIIELINKLHADYEKVKEGDYSPILTILVGKLYDLVKAEIPHSSDYLNSRMKVLLKSDKVDTAFKTRLKALMNSDGSITFDTDFARTFEVFKMDYDVWNADSLKKWKEDLKNQVFDKEKKDVFLDSLNSRRLVAGVEDREYRNLKKKINKQFRAKGAFTSSDISMILIPLKDSDEWSKVFKEKVYYSYFSRNYSLIDRVMNSLDSSRKEIQSLNERVEIVTSLLQALLSSQKQQGIKNFTFNEQQLESTKELMGKFIEHIDKSGRFNTAAVYLRSIVDNVSYNEADSIEQKPATISLSFESVLYSLKDQLVKPSQLYRTRYFQPYINIGVNYSGFLFPNELNVAEDGSTSTLKGMTFASEKIGFKYKIINREYTRSFKPGIVYKYYGHSWSWNRPQPQGLIDDLFLDIHTGGLLYNVVNLKTQDSFNFPYVGCGIGVRTFNGLTFSGAFNMPYTGNSFRKENAFITFGIDIPIIEYITAIRSK
ncbi:MAG: hypothetical protein QE487_07175 [Fluviicola sp.]|nr:hypothetical protein [Fluviicola sp.]